MPSSLEQIHDASEEIFHLYTQANKHSGPRHNVLCSQTAKEFLFSPAGLKGEIIIRQSQQQLSGLGVTGVVVWDSCIHLSMLMCQYFKAALNNKVVLELGSGCGLAGLVASRLGAKRVILTDQEQMQHILKQNIALNTANNTKKPFGIVEHRVLEWGEELPDLPKIDVVICSDCIYNEAIIDVFICTIEELLQQAEYALFAQELRSHYVIAELLEKVMAKGLLVWRVPECAGEGTSTGVVVYVISRSVMTCVNVEFTGGLELLCDSQKHHSIAMQEESPTVRQLVLKIANEVIKERVDLFLSDNSL